MNKQNLTPSKSDEICRRLAAMQSDLSKGTRRLAIFILSNPGATAILSSAEVAKRCDVQAPTLARLAQSLGLSGYRELQAIMQTDLSSSMALCDAARNRFESHS